MYSENPAMFKNRPLAFIVALLLIPVFGLGILILLYWYVSVKATRLSVSETDVLLEEGILSKTRSEVSIRSVRTTKISQTFMNRIFGTGTIEIFTAGDQPEIIAAGLPNPHSVRDLIKKYQGGTKYDG